MTTAGAARRRLLWWGLLIAALAMMGAGDALGEPMQTMMNAIMVCLSCMGIG